jgi:hypothetical protein
MLCGYHRNWQRRVDAAVHSLLQPIKNEWWTSTNNPHALAVADSAGM